MITKKGINIIVKPEFKIGEKVFVIEYDYYNQPFLDKGIIYEIEVRIDENGMFIIYNYYGGIDTNFFMEQDINKIVFKTKKEAIKKIKDEELIMKNTIKEDNNGNKAR